LVIQFNVLRAQEKKAGRGKVRKEKTRNFRIERNWPGRCAEKEQKKRPYMKQTRKL